CKALLDINTSINPKVERLLDSYDGPFARELKENMRIARTSKMPLCQDTGVVEFFIWKGYDIQLTSPLKNTLEQAVRDTYTDNGFRKGIVSDPLFERKNTLDNTPAIVHILEIDESTIDIWMIAKGGGSENLSTLFMLQPSESYENVLKCIVEHIEKNAANACPPIIVGIGIGGTSDKAILLSKLALFDPSATESLHRYDEKIGEYTQMADELQEAFSNLKIGVQGLGIGPTVQRTSVLSYPTHIATLPLAISVDCYLSRTSRVVIE
ncbi:MAG TPA: fumarate hydratase, partial [Fervidobacterium sp.]|nr:fumarate hydratase [Fervidobacterium sp.]